MESLRDGESTITDGRTIHKLITSFFANWFKRQPSEKGRDKLLADCILGRDRRAWDKLITDVGIPRDVSNNLWNAFQPKPISPLGLVEANNLSRYCPTYDEFKRHIDRLDSNSAPGASGLSYAMIKLWPDSLLRHTYDCLCETWINKTTLPGWSTKILAPIPKKQNPTIDDLRPLMLIEVTRKIWMGLIMDKIKNF
jgi:hypothetical protein